MRYVIESKNPSPVSIEGDDSVYPVRRMFCVGRNYAAHAAEMGDVVDREAPWYFTKSAHAVVMSGGTVPFALGTQNLHFEMELVVALKDEVFRADLPAARSAIYGYCCGLDMTRRDLQQVGKDHRRPWDLGKDIENGAILAPLLPAGKVGEIGPQRIALWQNGEVKQDATLADMVWSVPEIISHLSHYYHLGPGDMIMTGTPAGVGPVQPGDLLDGVITGLPTLSVRIGPPE